MTEKKEIVDFYLNPKAKKMCEMCYDKDKCNQENGDINFCKLNAINFNLSKVLKNLESKWE